MLMPWNKKLSVKEIEALRHKVIGLFLEPNEYLEISNPNPMKFFGIHSIELGLASTYPHFIWMAGGITNPKQHELILKHKQDFQIPEHIVVIARGLIQYMPFRPKENYLQNNGEPIA